MNCLAIETSTNICSVALFENKKMITIEEIDIPKSHSKELGKMIENLFKQSNIEINSIDFIAISSGPGSFTGLRIGSSLAKGIAFALELPLVLVPTLQALEYKLNIDEKHIIGLHSHKDKIYVQNFKNKIVFDDVRLVSISDLEDKLIYGYGLKGINKTIKYNEIKPSAELIGRLAFKNLDKWLIKDLSEAKLNYITNLNIN